MSKKNVKSAPAVAQPVQAQPNALSGVDMFGVRLSARGAIIDAVLIAAAVADEGPLSVKEISRRALASPAAADYLARTGRPLNAISNHVLHIFTGGHVVRDAKLGGYSVNLDKHGAAIAALKGATKPAAQAKNKKTKTTK